ncbi:hypothetical protein ACXIZN_30295 [Amycolatopsis sp. TRM77291]
MNLEPSEGDPMRSAHISRRQAEASFDGLEFDVSAVQAAAPMAWDFLEYTDEEREVDALIASVDAELAAATAAADVRVTHSFTDVRRATRSERRSGRTVLRALPSLLDTTAATSSEGEAA